MVPKASLKKHMTVGPKVLSNGCRGYGLEPFINNTNILAGTYHAQAFDSSRYGTTSGEGHSFPNAAAGQNNMPFKISRFQT